jgi:hypothetical protein
MASRDEQATKTPYSPNTEERRGFSPIENKVLTGTAKKADALP